MQGSAAVQKVAWQSIQGSGWWDESSRDSCSTSKGEISTVKHSNFLVGCRRYKCPKSCQLIVSQRGPGIYQATCYSTAPTNAIQLGLPTSYTIELHQSGSEPICLCPDFCIQGGACKHLQALQLIVDSWVKQGLEKPFHYPKTHDEAALLRSNMLIPEHQLAVQPLQPTLVTPVLWDPAFIQSLGQDSTTFDDQETIDTVADSDSNSNSSSDAVNLNSQQSQQTTLIVVQHHSAIATQIQQQLNYDLWCLLPSLHGLVNLLTDASTQSMTPELEELSDLLSSMQVSINYIMTWSAT